jgi:hypothetical protein
LLVIQASPHFMDDRLRTSSNFTPKFGWLAILGSIVLLVPPPAVFSQVLVGQAGIAWTQLSPGYSYTLALTNSATSTVPIETFWFAWRAGEGNFLETMPTVTKMPVGWTYMVTNDGSVDGYGIKFLTSTAPLQPNSSVVFGFTSYDSPSVLKARSVYFPEFPTTGSEIYSGHVVGTRQELVVAVDVSPTPLLRLQILPTQSVAISLFGQKGSNYVIETSSDTVRWTSVTNVSGPKWASTVAPAPGQSTGFYRATAVP